MNNFFSKISFNQFVVIFIILQMVDVALSLFSGSSINQQTGFGIDPLKNENVMVSAFSQGLLYTAGYLLLIYLAHKKQIWAYLIVHIPFILTIVYTLLALFLSSGNIVINMTMLTLTFWLRILMNVFYIMYIRYHWNSLKITSQKKV